MDAAKANTLTVRIAAMANDVRTPYRGEHDDAGDDRDKRARRCQSLRARQRYAAAPADQRATQTGSLWRRAHGSVSRCPLPDSPRAAGDEGLPASPTRGGADPSVRAGVGCRRCPPPVHQDRHAHLTTPAVRPTGRLCVRCRASGGQQLDWPRAMAVETISVTPWFRRGCRWSHNCSPSSTPSIQRLLWVQRLRVAQHTGSSAPDRAAAAAFRLQTSLTRATRSSVTAISATPAGSGSRSRSSPTSSATAQRRGGHSAGSLPSSLLLKPDASRAVISR